MSKLTKQEVEFIKKRKVTLEKQLKDSCSQLGSSGKLDMISGGEYDHLEDYSLQDEVRRLRGEISDLNLALSSSEVVEEPNNESVEVGTKFIATVTEFGKDSQTSKYILIGQAFLLNLDDLEYRPVSVGSPFGQAVLGKSCGEEVVYVTPNCKKFHAIIDEIICEKEKASDVKMQVKK